MASYNTRSATYTIKKQKEHLQSFMGSSECVKDVCRLQTKKESKLVQLVDKVLFTAMCSNGKPMTGPMTIEKSKLFYGEMKIKDKGTFSQGSSKNYLQELRLV